MLETLRVCGILSTGGMVPCWPFGMQVSRLDVTAFGGVSSSSKPALLLPHVRNPSELESKCGD